MTEFLNILKDPTVYVQIDEVKVIDGITDNLGLAGKRILAYLDRAIHDPNKSDKRIVAYFAYNSRVGELYLFLADNRPMELKPAGVPRKLGHIAVFIARSPMAMTEYFYECKETDPDNRKAYSDCIDYLKTQFYKNNIEIK